MTSLSDLLGILKCIFEILNVIVFINQELRASVLFREQEYWCDSVSFKSHYNSYAFNDFKSNATVHITAALCAQI